MKKNKQLKTSDMLLEVWKMKEKVYEETQNMSCSELFNYINQKTETAVSNIKKEHNTKV